MRTAPLTVILLLGVGIVGSNALLLSPILPDVAAALDTTPIRVSWAISAYGGATAVSALFLAPLIDRFGLRPALLWAGALLTAGMCVTAAAPSVVLLIGAQALAGAAAGVMLPGIYAAATRLGEEQGVQMLGRVLTGWSLSLVLGIPLGAFLTEAFGWRASYATLAGLGVIATAGFRFVPRFDLPPAASGAAPQAEAVRLPGVARLLLVQFLFMTAFYGTYALFGDHVRGAFALGPSAAGIVILVYGAGFGVAALADARLAALGHRAGVVAALACVGTVYAAMATVMTTTSMVFVLAFLWGFGNHAALNLIVGSLSRCAGGLRGTVMGLNSAVSYAGALAGPLAAGWLYVGPGFTALAACASVLVLAAAGMSVRLSAETRPATRFRSVRR